MKWLLALTLAALLGGCVVVPAPIYVPVHHGYWH